jgi:hypothetical protein
MQSKALHYRGRLLERLPGDSSLACSTSFRDAGIVKWLGLSGDAAFAAPEGFGAGAALLLAGVHLVEPGGVDGSGLELGEEGVEDVRG